MANGKVEVTINVEKIIHEKLSDFFKQIKDEHNIYIIKVEPKWLHGNVGALIIESHYLPKGEE